MDDLLQGALVLLRAPLALGGLLAVALVAAGALRWFACAPFAALCAVTAALPWPPPWTQTAAAGAVAVLGLVAAARWQPPAPLAWACTALGGAAAGWAADMPWATPGELAGGALVALAVVAPACSVVRTLQRRFALARVGMAILGAWIAALAVLLLLLALRTG